MSASVTHVVKAAQTLIPKPRIPRSHLKHPSPLPVRPLPVDKFRPPRGQKQVFLPNFVITFLHTPKLDPKFASFLVPLWFSKLDLKDYLYHLYGVKALHIRSYVIQSKVQEGKPRDLIPKRHNWFRPQSKKKMTVELVPGEKGQGPFVWPEEPKDWKPWAKEEFAQATKIAEEAQERNKNGEKMWPKNVDNLRKQAASLLAQAGRGTAEEKTLPKR